MAREKYSVAGRFSRPPLENLKDGCVTAMKKEKYIIDDTPDNIMVKSNIEELDNRSNDEIKKIRYFNFEPTSGWKGHIEFD